MRSIYSGSSGLINLSTGMDVIGNNISNVNTPGFKAGTASFQDVMSQTLQGAGSPNGNLGGTNPMQIGLGMSVAAIGTNFKDGNFQTTNKSSDFALSGNGFFILSNGKTDEYTRAGSFTKDAAGNYVAANGYKLQGWMADDSGTITQGSGLANITIPDGLAMAAKKTSQVTVTKNLQADATVGTLVSGQAIATDTLGVQHKIDTNYYKVDDNTWLMKISPEDQTKSSTTAANDMQLVTFNTDGSFLSAKQAVASNQKVNITLDELNSTVSSKTTKAWTANDNGTIHNYQLDITATSGTAWNYTLTDTANGVATTSTGTIAYTSAGAGYAAPAPTVALPTLDTATVTSTGSAPIAVGASTVTGTYTGAGGPPFTSGTLALSFGTLSKDTANSPQAITLATNVLGSDTHTHDYKMTLTYAGNNTWNYSVKDTDHTTPATVYGTVTGTVTYSNGTPTYTPTATTSNVPLQFNTSLSALAPQAGTASVTSELATSISISSLQLDSTAGSSHTQNFTSIVNGVPQVYKMTITKPSSGTGNTWNYTLSQVGVSNAPVSTGTITDTGTAYSGFPTIIGGTSVALPAYSAPVASNFMVKQDFTTTYTTSTLSNYNVSYPGGADPLTISIDSTALTQNATGTSTSSSGVLAKADGYAAGTLSDTASDTSGRIIGTYDNGQKKVLAQIALAAFTNPEGLTKDGSTNFIVSNNSGQPEIGSAGTGGYGKLASGGLEGSNVDLSQEFTNMIVTERGFQANSKIITTSDEMLQELNSLKR